MTWVLDDQAPAYAVHNVSSTTWNPFTIAVGPHRHLFVTVCIAETPAATVTLDKPVGETNNWVQIATNIISPGGGAGEQTTLFGIKTTLAWNHSLQVTFSGAKVAKIANWTAFTGGSLVPRVTCNVSPYSKLPFLSVSTFSGQSEARDGDLVIGFATGDTVPTLDSDTTNGSWVDAGNAAGGAVVGGEQIAMRMEYKITTGRGPQTLNGVGAASLGAGVLAPRDAFSVITEGGDIDSATAHPDWYFRTAAAPGPDLFAMKVADLLLGGTHHKNYNTPITTPAGYTKQGFGKTDGTIAGTSTQVNAFERIADGTEGAKIVVTTTGGLGAGSMMRARGGVEEESTWDVETVFGADTSLVGTTISIVADAPLDLQPGDKVYYFLSVNFHDAPTAIVIGGLGGFTFTQYDIGYNGYITDPDGGISMGYVEIDAGSGPATPTLTANYNSGLSAAPAAFVRVRYGLPPPDQVFNVECDEATSDSITITWDNPSGGEFDPTYNEVKVGDAGTPITLGLVETYEFTGLDPSTSYDLYVRACNDDGCSDWEFTTCVTCPPAPTNLTVQDVTPSGFTICWEETP